MIKKLLLLVLAISGLAITGSAKSSYSHDSTVLPLSAKTTIANNFKSQISVVKLDKDFGRIHEYEVILTDGTEVTFDKNGNWKNVEVRSNASVPSAFVPKAISDYVKKAQPGQKIVGIEKQRSGYEIELTNGVDMKFNKQGEFQKYD